MIYIAYFRYEFDDPNFGKSEGRFTYAIDAANIEEACRSMEAAISEKHVELMHDTDKLFLDDVIEIASLPEGGTVLRLDYGPQRDELPVFTSLLPNLETEGCSTYRQGPDPDDDVDAANAYEPEPFLEFDEVEEGSESE